MKELIDKDAYYFPHYCNARHDRKVRRITKELGVEGYGIFFMLLEVLREQTDYKFPLQDIDLLADEFGTSEQKVRTVISNYDLFSTDEEQRFFSSNLILYLQPYLSSKENRRVAGIKGNLIKYGHCKRDDLIDKTHAEIKAMGAECFDSSLSDRPAIAQPSQVKESKVNKVKESKLIIDAFNLFWNVYPNKQGKKKAMESYTKAYKTQSLPDDLLDIIKKWVQTDNWKNEGGKYIPLPATWLNGERWDDELPKQKDAGVYVPRSGDNGLKFDVGSNT